MTTAIGTSTARSSPDPSTLDALDDTMSELYTVISELRQNDVEAGQGQVTSDQAETQRQDAAERTAIQQEEANAADSGSGFFSSIGHFFGDVASDLVHGDIGGAFTDAGHDLDAAWNSPAFWSDLETGLRDVAVVAAAAGSVILTAGAAGIVVGAGIAAAVTTVGLTAGAGAALAGVKTGEFAANAEDASADATQATNRMTELQELTTDVIADLKDADKSHQQSLQGLTQAMQTNDATIVAPASITVKG